MIKVYVAGASSELDRAKAAMNFVRRTPGLYLAQDWVADIKGEGDANPADPDIAYAYADKDRQAVLESDLFWLLMPHPGNVTIGAWVEYGVAVGAEGARVLVSGPMQERSIFTSLADRSYPEDEGAMDMLRKMAAAEGNRPEFR